MANINTQNILLLFEPWIKNIIYCIDIENIYVFKP